MVSSTAAAATTRTGAATPSRATEPITSLARFARDSYRTFATGTRRSYAVHASPPDAGWPPVGSPSVKLVDLARDPGLRAGLAAGLFTTLVVAAVALLRRGRGAVPLAGLAAAVATVIGLRISTEVPEVPGELVAGLAALGLASLAPKLPGPALAYRLVAVTPGAVLVAAAADLDLAWAVPFTVAATVLGAILVTEFDRLHARTGLAPVLLGMTALGVYGCVPDTEEASVLVGAALPVALLGWPKPLASLGAAGAHMAVGLVVWTAVFDGRGRSGAIVGATACLGIMMLEPLLDGARRRAPLAAGRWCRRSFALAGTHLALVAVCSRVAGIRSSPVTAAVIAALAFVAAAVVLEAVTRLDARR